jgi:hypothetical protein
VDFTGDLKDYYFPITSDTMVYTYQTKINDRLVIGYDIMWSDFGIDTSLNKVYLTESLDSVLRHRYLINNYGVFYNESFMYKREPHFPKDVSVSILKDSIFLWDYSTKTYCIAWNDSYADRYRERKFLGHSADYTLDSDSISTVQFEDFLWVDFHGTKQEQAIRYIEYAKGIGQVKEVWNLPEGKSRVRTLINISSYSDWLMKNGL